MDIDDSTRDEIMDIVKADPIFVMNIQRKNDSKAQINKLIQNRANIFVIMFWSEFISFRGFLLRRMTHAFCFGACVSTHRNLESLSLIMPCVNTKRLDL